jgi:hypothetical protein
VFVPCRASCFLPAEDGTVGYNTLCYRRTNTRWWSYRDSQSGPRVETASPRAFLFWERRQPSTNTTTRALRNNSEIRRPIDASPPA